MQNGVPESGITVYVFDKHTLADSSTESEASSSLPHNQWEQLPMVNNTVHSHMVPAHFLEASLKCPPLLSSYICSIP